MKLTSFVKTFNANTSNFFDLLLDILTTKKFLYSYMYIFIYFPGCKKVHQSPYNMDNGDRFRIKCAKVTLITNLTVFFL